MTRERRPVDWLNDKATKVLVGTAEGAARFMALYDDASGVIHRPCPGGLDATIEFRQGNIIRFEVEQPKKER